MNRDLIDAELASALCDVEDGVRLGNQPANVAADAYVREILTPNGIGHFVMSGDEFRKHADHLQAIVAARLQVAIKTAQEA